MTPAAAGYFPSAWPSLFHPLALLKPPPCWSAQINPAVRNGPPTAATRAEDLTAEQLYERGYQENEHAQYEKAISDFTAAINKNPEYWKAYANRSAARYHSHDYGSALQDINIAAPHLPGIKTITDLKKAIEEAIARESNGPNTVVMRQPVYRNSTAGVRVVSNGADGITAFANTLMAHGYAIPKDLVHPMTGHLINPIGGNSADPQKSAQDFFDHGCEKAKTIDFGGAIKDFDECIKLDLQFAQTLKSVRADN